MNCFSGVALKVLFSSGSGCFIWTPILILAVGPFFYIQRDALLGEGCLPTFLAYYFVLPASGLNLPVQFWQSFFCFSDPIFILGLCLPAQLIFFELDGERRGERKPPCRVACPVLALLIGCVERLHFHSTHMVLARGRFPEHMVHNQFVEVPLRITHSLETYFLHRGEMMQHIEQEDIEQQKLERAPRK